MEKRELNKSKDIKQARFISTSKKDLKTYL